MIRTTAFAVAFSLFAAAPLRAQIHDACHAAVGAHRGAHDQVHSATHPQTHPPTQARQHGAHPAVIHGTKGHEALNPALHASLHENLVGCWKGTLTTSRQADSPLTVALARDSAGKVAITLAAEQGMRAGRATNFVVEKAKLRWTQDVAGVPCQASGEVIAATKLAPEAIKGKLACKSGDLSFMLHKAAPPQSK